MASKLGGKRTRVPLFDWNKISHEIRMIVLDEGNGLIEELAKKILEEAKAKAPQWDVSQLGPVRGVNKRPPGRGDNKEGPLRDMMFAEPSAKVPASWIVCAPTWYSHFVEYGTVPHEMPRKMYHQQMQQGTRKKMTFKVEGRWVTTDWVYHTGARQKPFLRPARDKAEQLLKEVLTKRGYTV